MQYLFSVTKKDFVRQTFTVGGHGGSGKDTSNSGVRLIHPPSGAIGEGREHRTNARNEQSAFEKLVKSDKFQKWIKYKAAKILGTSIAETKEEILERVNRMVDEDLKNGNIVIEEV